MDVITFCFLFEVKGLKGKHQSSFSLVDKGPGLGHHIQVCQVVNLRWYESDEGFHIRNAIKLTCLVNGTVVRKAKDVFEDMKLEILLFFVCQNHLVWLLEINFL